MTYRWNFASVFDNWQALAMGLAGTLKLSIVCLILGLSLGLLVGFGRRARRAPIRWLSTAFVEFFRNTPVLIQILWFYFALPMIAPIEVSPFLAAVLGITLNAAAYSSEIYRGGIQSIEPGQTEAARAIGMSGLQTLRRIVIPQAVRRILPALTNRGIEIVKTSTLASVVAYVELMQQGKLIASLNFNPIEAYTVVGVMFMLLLYPFVRATYAIERRLARSD